MKDIQFSIHERGYAKVTLNREATQNAFDDNIIFKLLKRMDDVRKNPAIKLLLIKANGKSFCSGADLKWMRKTADFTEDQNYQDALNMANFFQALDTLPQPTLAIVQGAAYGGGLGIIAACDIAIASTSAKFGLPEVKLGLIPAVVSPYLIRVLGESIMKRYSLTGETFYAEEARRIGLIHNIVPPQKLHEAEKHYINLLLQNSPLAMKAIKTQLHLSKKISHTVIKQTARLIADLRSSKEAKEGIAAFLEKRQPHWTDNDV